MMKRYKWLALTGLALIAASVLMYLVHYLIFGDPHHIFIYLVGDIAFVPIEVFLVVLIIERMLHRHEKQAMLSKLNMVIGTFFSELGTQLLGRLTQHIENREQLGPRLAVNGSWSAQDFKNALSFVRTFEYEVSLDTPGLKWLKQTLAEKRDLLLMLLANPNLLEHERFTDLLWAVFHLLEELTARDSLEDLPETDRSHLAGDAARVYATLSVQWLLHCQHLQTAYPFIFSIIVRTHPLQENPCAVVKS